MFFASEQRPYPVTGTSTQIHVPRESPPRVLKPGAGYFLLRIKSAQAAFTGPLWERVKSLIVTSQVSLHHQTLGTEPLVAIQRAVSVRRNTAVQLGMSQTLIRLTPAIMPHITISIDFILDKENQLAALAGLINDNTFLAAVSLAPGALPVARTIGALSQKLLQAFIGQPEDRKPIMQFTGDFPLVDGLRDGFYVILGTSDEANPLPEPPWNLEVREEALFIAGQRATQLSYVVLEVMSVSARGRESNDGAQWDLKLRQAEDIAANVAGNPFIQPGHRDEAWEKSLALMTEAQALLLTDVNYLRREAQDIIKAAFAYCHSEIFSSQASRGSMLSSDTGIGAPEKMRAGRESLGIAGDEDLDETLLRYADQVAESRRALHGVSIT